VLHSLSSVNRNNNVASGNASFTSFTTLALGVANFSAFKLSLIMHAAKPEPDCWFGTFFDRTFLALLVDVLNFC